MWLAGRHQVSTEDAYVEGAVVTISARVPGPVAKVHGRDNEDVRAGQLLVEIDPRDFQIPVEQARAAVAMAAAEARGARSEVPLARESTLYDEVQRQAGMNAFADDFRRLAAIFVVMVPLVWLMRRPAETPRPQPVDAA